MAPLAASVDLDVEFPAEDDTTGAYVCTSNTHLAARILTLAFAL